MFTKIFSTIVMTLVAVALISATPANAGQRHGNNSSVTILLDIGEILGVFNQQNRGQVYGRHGGYGATSSDIERAGRKAFSTGYLNGYHLPHYGNHPFVISENHRGLNAYDNKQRVIRENERWRRRANHDYIRW